MNPISNIISTERFDRIVRLLNNSPNLNIPHFMNMRRNDWSAYLQDISTPSTCQEDFAIGIKKWSKEDPEGVKIFLDNMKSMQTG